MAQYFGPVRVYHTDPFARCLRMQYARRVWWILPSMTCAYTFASRLVMSGGDLSTVQALMGHKDISMTFRYTYLSSDHKQRAIRILESFTEKSHNFSHREREEGSDTA